MTQEILGRPVREALALLPGEAEPPRIVETAPARKDARRRDGTLRVVACRGNEWIAARFHDGPPRKKEEP